MRTRTSSVVPCLSIVHHPDSSRVGERARLSELARGGEVLLSRLGPLFEKSDGSARGEPLSDPFVSRTPAVLSSSGDGGVRITSPAGDIVVGNQAISGRRDFSADELAAGVVFELRRRVVLLLHVVGTIRHRGASNLGLVGESDALESLRAAIRRVADLDMPVLIRGESGTGKELVARAIHQASARRNRTHVSVSMASIAPSVAVSEQLEVSRRGLVLRMTELGLGGRS